MRTAFEKLIGLLVENKVRTVIRLVDATQNAHSRYQKLGESQENVARMPYIKDFHPVSCEYSNLITRSLKTETQYSPNKNPQKPDKPVD
jgi:hypothetical protein